MRKKREFSTAFWAEMCTTIESDLQVSMERVRICWLKDDCKTAIYFQFASSVADAATIIIVNLYIRSFAKIDDVKMVNSIFIPTSIRLLHTRTLNFKCIQMYSTWSIPYICRSTVFKLHSVRIGMTIGSTTRASSLTETCEVCTFKTHILNQMLQKPDSICRLHRMNF